MKKTFLQIIFLFVAMVGYAQSDIHFTILKSETKGLSEDVVDALDLKLHQVFNRNSAAAADVYNVFAVIAVGCLSTKCCLQTVAW